MPEKISLARWQARFANAVAIKACDAKHLSARQRGPVSFSVRLEVYRHAYRVRLLGSLEEDFPQLIAYLGNRKFQQLAKDYLPLMPAGLANPAEVSAPFVTFLRKKLGKTSLEVELATWEMECRYCEMTLENTGTISEPDEDTWLRLSSPTRLMKANYPLLAATKKEKQKSRPTFLVATKYRGNLRISEVSSTQAKILKALRAPLSLNELAAWLSGRRIKPELVQQWIADWVAQGIVTAGK